MKVLLEGERLTALRAYQQGHLIISWGNLDNPEHLRNVANRFGWPMPTCGLMGWLIDMLHHQTWRWPTARLREAFLAKMFENDKNFDLAVMGSGIDVYVPDSECVKEVL
jgi:hypothetical protein